MPPKKGPKDGAAKLADKENLARAEAEILSLQHLLELRSHEVRKARGNATKPAHWHWGTRGRGVDAMPCLSVRKEEERRRGGGQADEGVNR